MRLTTLLPALTVAALVGCNSSPPTLSPRAPHGGMIIEMPDNQGVVEIVRRESANQPGHDQMLLYFLDAKLQPMSPAPTSATLKLRGKKAESIEFRPPSALEPSQAGMLQSPDLPGNGEVDGLLTMTIAGKLLSLSINLR